MRDIRREREERGLTLRQAADATGIPIDILASLEAEADAQLRPGSTIARWRKKYVAYLQEQALEPSPAPFVPEVDDDPPEPTETTTILSGPFKGPMPLLRALVGGSVLALAVVMGLWLAAGLLEPEQQVEQAASAKAAVHKVSIRAIEPTSLRVEADGKELHDAVLHPRRPLSFEAHEVLALDIPDLTRVRIRYNGAILRPVGNLSAGRRLVFIDDEGR